MHFFSSKKGEQLRPKTIVDARFCAQNPTAVGTHIFGLQFDIEYHNIMDLVQAYTLAVIDEDAKHRVSYHYHEFFYEFGTDGSECLVDLTSSLIRRFEDY